MAVTYRYRHQAFAHRQSLESFLKEYSGEDRVVTVLPLGSCGYSIIWEHEEPDRPLRGHQTKVGLGAPKPAAPSKKRSRAPQPGIAAWPRTPAGRAASQERCPECGLPYGQCDPEGIGHYRG